MTFEQPDEHAGLVGRTSARLLAVGVHRADRLEALHLLAVLDASTDADGRVRRPLDDLAAEFDLPPVGVLQALDNLELVGAVRRDGAAVVLVDRDPGGIGGLHLADFLDDVRASIDRGDRHARARRGNRVVRAGAAMLAAAAALVVVTLAPSQPATVQSSAASSTSSTAAREVDAPTAPRSDELSVTTAVPDRVDDSPFEPPSVDEGVIAAACPEGGPIVEVVGSTLTITNPTAADLVVQQLTIGAVTTTRELEVPAGASIEQELPLAAADVTLDEWDWADADLAGRCGS